LTGGDMAMYRGGVQLAFERNASRSYGIPYFAADLVGWGWAPGPGRTPVATPRGEVVAAMQAWADAGTPCPE
jgi:hypothetical protein